jgi:hypothetical protein
MCAELTFDTALALCWFKNGKLHGKAVFVCKEYVGTRDWVHGEQKPIEFIFTHDQF